MQQVSRKDVEASLAGVPQSTENRLLATRVIVEALADPSQEFSVAALADATGLTRHKVTQILTSDEFRQLIQDACRDKVAGVLLKAIHRVDREIVSNTQASPKLVLEATKVLTATHGALAKSVKEHDAGQAEEDFRRFLAGMKPANVTIERLENAEDG